MMPGSSLVWMRVLAHEHSRSSIMYQAPTQDLLATPATMLAWGGVRRNFPPPPIQPPTDSPNSSDAPRTLVRNGVVLSLVVQVDQPGCGIEIRHPRGLLNTVVKCQVGAEDRVEDKVHKAAS
jgi:hypothetical protein